MQFKTAIKLHYDLIERVDYPENDVMPRKSNFILRNSTEKFLAQLQVQRMRSYERKSRISQFLDSESDDKAPKFTKRITHVDQPAKESIEQVADIQQRHQIMATKEDKNSNDYKKVKNETLHVINSSTTVHTELPIFSEEQRRKKRKTRVIFGIMTYDSTTEQRRRGLIRRTFLSYFRKHMNRTLVTDEEYNEKKYWICSLNDLDRERLEYPEKCRMAYAFVKGANPNGTSMLLNFNKTHPLSVHPPKNQTKDERKDASDSIYLNIKENGRYGKSPTWFRYAIDVLERHGWMEDWDYIFKSDTDNLIYTPNFFRFMDRLSKKKAVRIYGGLPLDYAKCGGDNHDDCKQMIGPYFMQGGCYFLSIDLAKFISDETTFDHQAVKLPHEDMTTGNFVYSHPQKIRVVGEPKKKEVIRKHPVKKDKSFIFRWNKMLREEHARLAAGRDKFSA